MERADLQRLGLGSTKVIYVSFLTTGVLVRNAELTSHRRPKEFRKGQKEKGDDPYVLPTSQHPSRWCPSWLSDPHATRKDPESERLARYNPETNPIPIKPETVSPAAEQSSWVPSSSCSLPGRPFPTKSLALSACVSPWTVYFQVLDKSPPSGPGRGPPSCNNFTSK